MSFAYPKLWGEILDVTLGEINHWLRKRCIPLGTLQPYHTYKGNIPVRDIVVVPFDAFDADFTTREAFNILMLGGSGDGKSLLMKIIWFILHYAGYWCGVVDPKSTDSGRASVAWNSQKLPPKLEPNGIKLKHFMPIWATEEYQHMVHNFEIYSTRLHRIYTRQMWQGLGMTEIGASNVTNAIKTLGRDVSINTLMEVLKEVPGEMMPKTSLEACMRVLVRLVDSRAVNESVPEVDLHRWWKEGYSLCFSYNDAEKINLTFDIGQKIKQSSRLYHTLSEADMRPVMWFLDDSGFYAKEFPKILKHGNFCIQEIINIGINYRSLGINNCLAVQGLNFIDEGVAESYKIKILTPAFQGTADLAKIGIPPKAIKYLKKAGQKNGLIIDRSKYLMQYLLVDQDKNVVPFFPFTPPCNHFSPIYFPKRNKEELVV